MDNIYLVRPNFLDGNAYLYRFLVADNYAKPLISKIERGSHGKYSMAYDRMRKQLYYFSANNMFFVIGLDGEVRSSRQLLQAGKDAGLQYPLLNLDRNGTLHAAWTTQKHGVYLYWDIHYMLSRDGGETWEKMDGTPIALPAMADQNGPTDRITLDDEYEVHTWLSNFMAKNGKLHFVYMAQTWPRRQHYVRYDLKTVRREVDIWPEFKGEKISLLNLDGFFASRVSQPNSPLYVIAAEKEGYGGLRRLACLASDDNGKTWYDYAVSEMYFNPYSIGGARDLTADGYIIGSFTDQKDPPSVYFFRIQAGVSGAKVVSARSLGEMATLKLADVRFMAGVLASFPSGRLEKKALR